MKLAFILGRKHSLALAEILEVLRVEDYSYETLSVSTYWLVLDLKTNSPVENVTEKLQKRLGGTVKIAEIVEEIPVKNLEDLQLSLLEKMITPLGKKVNIAISIYGDIRALPRNFQKELGMSLKTYYKEMGFKASFAYSGKTDTSSVTFTKKIKGKGADINFLVTRAGQVFIGKTITAQDFESYSKRDYGRPMVSKKSGALPPKLAQIMVNLTCTSKDKYVYDPFCGSGTVLQESMVLGYNVIGSDIDRKAVQQTEQNLGWLKKHYLNSSEPSFQILHAPVRTILENDQFLRKFIEKDKIGGIATEPYLGPTLRNVIVKDKNYDYMLDKISAIYQDIFEALPGILAPGQRFVFVLPEYKTTVGWEGLEINELYEKDFTKLDLLDTLPESDFGHLDKQLVWDRPQSIIRRNIITLERN
jgi:tRNA G10  N-methylase Trm11